MHLIHVRQYGASKSPIVIAVSGDHIAEIASIFEDSKRCVNFKVDEGIDQSKFGFGNFTKWVTRNYPENE